MQKRENCTARLRSEEGSVIILVGLVALILILAVGCAVDMARAQILQQRISAALDAAGLAAAQTVNNPPSTYPDKTTWANAEAVRYFSANFPAGYLGSSSITPVVVLSDGDSKLNLTANGTQTTVFMQNFGVNTVNVGATSVVQRSDDKQGMEIVLVLDDTGSMNFFVNATSTTRKIDALNSAAKLMIDTLFAAGDTLPNHYVSIVPFSVAVNTPSTVQSGSWMDGSDPNAGNWKDSESWKGCVTSRDPSANSLINPAVGGTNVTMDISEDTPTSAKFDEYYYSPAVPYYHSTLYLSPSNYNLHNTTFPSPSTADDNGYVNFNPWWGPGPTAATWATQKTQDVSGVFSLTPVVGFGYHNTYSPTLQANMGPNALCPPAVSPMMTSATDIKASIDTLTSSPPVGNTMINLGMAWGWRLLSPNWRGWWSASGTLPLDYNTPNIPKYVILMTDGTNYTTPGVYSAYGFKDMPTDTDMENAAEDLDARTLAVCQSMKNDGITIFAIGFGAPAPHPIPTLQDRQKSTYVDGDLLSQCASPGDYYAAPTNADLQNAFQKIADILANIRVSQ